MKIGGCSRIGFLCIAALLMIIVIHVDHKQRQERCEDFRMAATLVKQFYENSGSYTILDCMHNEENSFMPFIAVFRKEGQNDDSNLLITGPTGTAVLNFGGNQHDFKYLSENQLVFISEDTISFSFEDQSNGDIYDFTVRCIMTSPIDVMYEVNSKIR